MAQVEKPGNLATQTLCNLSWVLFQIALLTLQFGTRAACRKSKSLASLVLLSRHGTCHGTRIVRLPCCSMRGIVLLARTMVQREVLRAVNGQRPGRQMVGQRCSLGCPETLAQQHEVLLALGPANFKLLPTHPSGFE